MKKITAVLLSILSICVLAACGQNGGNRTPSSQAAETVRVEETTQAEAITQAEATTQTAETGEETKDGQTNILVAYFSCTNTTRPLAEYAADALGADLYEIVPEIPYTQEDLNYSDSGCRANREQNNPDSRPEISGSVEEMGKYDIVFLGYPNMEQGFESVLCA